MKKSSSTRQSHQVRGPEEVGGIEDEIAEMLVKKRDSLLIEIDQEKEEIKQRKQKLKQEKSKSMELMSKLEQKKEAYDSLPGQSERNMRQALLAELRSEEEQLQAIRKSMSKMSKQRKSMRSTFASLIKPPPQSKYAIFLKASLADELSQMIRQRRDPSEIQSKERQLSAIEQM